MESSISKAGVSTAINLSEILSRKAESEITDFSLALIYLNKDVLPTPDLPTNKILLSN